MGTTMEMGEMICEGLRETLDPEGYLQELGGPDLLAVLRWTESAGARLDAVQERGVQAMARVNELDIMNGLARCEVVTRWREAMGEGDSETEGGRE